MRKWITLLMTLLVGCGSYANANIAGQVDFEAGYRRDNIDWRHRFPSNDPVASSSIRFKDLDIFQIALNGRATLGCNFYARANAYWGWILDGDFRNKINAYFSDDGFCDENFRFGFHNDRCTTIDDKYVFGVGGAIGYPFFFCDCTMTIAPVIGYAFDEQNIEIDDRGFSFDDYDVFGCGSGGFGCCEKHFISRWYGPFVGIDFEWRPYSACFDLWAELEYHWGHFRGRRSECQDDSGFNFFDDHNRSSHQATGWVFAAGFDYDLCNCWTVGLSVKFQDWSATRHHRICRDDSFDSYFFGSFCDNRIRTNHKWRSYAINLTFGREF